MKAKYFKFKKSACGLAATLGFTLVSQMAVSLQAQVTGTWNVNANGNWSAGGSWSGGTIPNGAGHIANFTNNINGTRTVTIDAGLAGTTATVGILNFGDSDGTNSFTISGGTLVFDNSGANAQINMGLNGSNNTIASAMVLNNPLDITITDASNNQGMILSGIISGGPSILPGTTAITINDPSADASLGWVLINNANTFQGQVLVQSGLLRYEGNNAAAGAVGVGNETVVAGGAVDLRDRDFNVQGDNTEIFLIEGMGPNGLGALRNTAGTGTIAHLALTGDSGLGGYSPGMVSRRLSGDGATEIAAIVDLAGHSLTKLGSSEWRFHNADIRGRTGAVVNIFEGEIKFENNGALLGGALIDGSTYGNNLDGLVINVTANRNTYDGVDPANGTRTSDPFNPNRTASPTSGNSINDPRLSFGTYWSGTNTHAANSHVSQTFDNFTVNFSNGTWQREGNGDAGRTFDQIFGPNVTLNLVAGGIGRDSLGSGNLFDVQGGSGNYNGTLGVWDYPGALEYQGVIDNTSLGNNGTGFTVRGSREMRLVSDNSTSFDGDILIKQPTYRWVTNSFTTSGTAPAAPEYTNLSLAGPNGSLAGAGTITLTRWGSLALLNSTTNPNYPSANHNNRLNDGGVLSFRNGFLKLQTDGAVNNTENLGNVQADYGSNYLYLDTRAGGTFNGSLQSFTRSENGLLKIYVTHPSQTFGAAGADNTLLVNTTTGITTVGTGTLGGSSAPVVIGAMGGVLPTLATPTIGTYTRSLETVQGSFMYAGGGMELMTLDNGYLRPLTASEFDTSALPAAGSNWRIQGYVTPGNTADKNNYAGRQITADTTLNSLTIGFDAAASGQAVPTAAKDYLILQTGTTLTLQSGLINLNSFVEANSANMEVVIRGGSLNMDGRLAIINSNAIWHDLDRNTANWYEVITGNNAFMRSSIVNAGGLVKTGRNNLYLDTANEISGNVYISEQGSIIARHPQALGAGGASREVQVGGGAAFLLEYGTNLSGIDLVATNTIQGSATLLRNEGATHSTWGGDIKLDVADAYGTSEFQSYAVTARHNGTLTVGGNIYTINNASLTDSDSFSDPPLITSSYGETYTLNLRGQFRDIATGNLGTDPANAGITSIFRTGDSATRLDSNHSLRFQMSGHDEGNVNVFQQWDATGRLDLRQGYFRIQYDPTGYSGNDNGFYTDGARALISANDYYNRAVLGADGTSTTNAYHSHVLLTKPDQLFNAPYLYAYNDNRNGTLTLGGENESGSVYYGSRDNTTAFGLQYANQTSERDVRFLQVRGGTTVFNGRLDDENSTTDSFNAVASVVGPGTVIFNRNSAAGSSDIDRWNFLGGEARWGGAINGNNQFARTRGTSGSGVGGVSGWGGGGLVLEAQGTARTQTLDGNIFLLGGASYVNVNTNTTFTMGAASPARTLTRRAGASLSFLEDDNGAVNITANGLSTTAGDFLGTWAVYGSAASGVEHWAARQSTTGVQAYAAYSAGVFGTGLHTDLGTDQVLGASTASATLRIGAAGNVQLTVGEGNTLTLEQGGLLVPASSSGDISLVGGSLTSTWSGGGNELLIHNHGSGTLTLGSAITDNGVDRVSLTVAGGGRVVLSSENSFTGDTFVNGGVLEIAGDSALGEVNASIAKIVRVAIGSTNGASVTNRALTFTSVNAPAVAATGTYSTNSSSQITGLALAAGGSGYTTGVYVSTDVNTDGTVAGDGNGGVRAIMDSGNLHLNGGTLHATETMALNGARTIFLGTNGGTLQVDPGKTLTIDGYITSEFSHATTANGYTAINHIGTDWQPASDRNPDIGDLLITGGGTVTLTGAPDGVVRAFQTNNYGGITWINEGILRIATAGTSVGGDIGYSGIFGTNRSWIDGTVIGDQGTLMLNTTSDASVREWLTFRGQGYEGMGTIVTTGTARAYSLAGQMFIEQDLVINNRNSSGVYLNNGGGDLVGPGSITRTGNGTLRFYGNVPEWTGALNNAARDLYIASAANLQGMSSMNLQRDSIVYYEAGSTSVNEFRDRLNDSMPVNTDGYIRLRLRPTGGVYSGEEDTGVLNVQGGQVRLEFDLGADIVSSAARLTGDYGIWHFDQINRSSGTSVHLATLDAGTSFAGAGFGASQWENLAGVRVDTAPATVGTGDGSNGNTPVVPGFFGGVRPLWVNTAGTGNHYSEDRISNRLITVATTDSGAKFLRPLETSDYVSLSHPGAAVTETLDLGEQGLTADQNLLVLGATADAGFTTGEGAYIDRRNSLLKLNMPLTVNSLSFESETYAFDDRAVNTTSFGGGRGNFSAVWIDPKTKLTLNSGMVVYSNTGFHNVGGDAFNPNWNMDIRSAINGGDVDMNGQDAHFNVGGVWAFYNSSDAVDALRAADGDNAQLFLNASVVNAVNFIKTGPSSMFVQAAQKHSGDTYINHGILYARHDGALGQGSTVYIQGSGNLINGHGADVAGKDVLIGRISGNNLGLALQDGASWRGDVIVDNIDIAGTTSYVRAFTPRIYSDSTRHQVLYGDIYGGATAIAGPGLTDSRMWSSYTGGAGIFDLKGRVMDNASGSLAGPLDTSNINGVLRSELLANNNEMTIQVWNPWQAAGRIRLLQANLVYMGSGNFYDPVAASAIESAIGNSAVGFQMGGRSVMSGDGGANDDLAFFLANAGSNFNLSSWEVGVETYDPENLSGNDNFNRGNVGGNSTLGGLNRSGSVSFGTGTGAVTFTNMTRFAAYDRDLRLFANEGGTVNLNAALVDGGTGVNSSITKIGRGTVNLNGSSAGDSTVEAVNVLGGYLQLAGYGANAGRRVGSGAALRLGGGALVLDGATAAAPFSEVLGAFNITAGGSALAAVGPLATLEITGAPSRAAAGQVHFQSIAGGTIRLTGAGASSRLGSWATFGQTADATPTATGWAATDGSGNVVAFSGYSTDSFGTGNHTDVVAAGQTAAATASVRFDTSAGTLTSGTLTLSDGGLLITSNYAGTEPIAAGVGLTTGGADLIIHNFAPAAVTLSGDISGAQNVVFNGTGTTVLGGTNSHSGATFVTGAATVAFDSPARLGSTSAITLNGGGLSYTAAATTSAAMTQTVTIGDNGATIGVTDAGSRLVLRASGTNQFVGTANPVAAITSGNPFSGDLTFAGPGTIQFGDRSATAATQDLLGLQATYTGLTYIGDGINPVKVDLQGQGNDSSYYTIFGTTYSWADATILRDKATLEISPKRGDGSRDQQVRLREWFQFGEEPGDQVTVLGSTQRQPTLDGQLRIVGDVTFNATGNLYADAGSTGNSEILLNPNEGGIFGAGGITKTGNGNLRFYNPMREWTGDLDIQDGFVGIQSWQTSMFEPTGQILFGDPLGLDTSGLQMRVETRFGNTDTSLDSGVQTMEISRDILIRDNIRQEVRLSLGYSPETILTFSGDIYLGSGSTAVNANHPAHVRFYNEDTTGINGSLVGHGQHSVFNITGNLSGSNNLMLDHNEGGSANDDTNDQFTTFLFSGDNSGFTGRFTVGPEAGAGTGNFDRDDIEIFRAGSATALSAANDVELRNLAMFQAGGQNLTIGNLTGNDGNSSTGLYSFTSPTWAADRLTTADLDAKAGQAIHGTAGVITATDYTPLGDSSAIVENGASTAGTLTVTQTTDGNWDVLFRDGQVSHVNDDVTQAAAALSLVKAGAARAVMTIFNDYTGTTTVSEGALQVGNGGTGQWALLAQGTTVARTAVNTDVGGSRAVGSTGWGPTSVLGGATLSGSGHVRGQLNVAGSLAPGDVLGGGAAGSDLGTLFVGGSGSVAGASLTISNGTLTLQVKAPTTSEAQLGAGGTYYLNDQANYESFVAMLPAMYDGTATNPLGFGQTGTHIQAGAQHDHLEIGGGIVWNGGQIEVAAFDGFAPAAGDVYNLMDWYGVASWNTFDSGDRYRVGGEAGTDLTLPDLSAFDAALRWDTGLFASHGILVVAVVPEPGRALLLVLGLTALLMRRRR